MHIKNEIEKKFRIKNQKIGKIAKDRRAQTREGKEKEKRKQMRDMETFHFIWFDCGTWSGMIW